MKGTISRTGRSLFETARRRHGAERGKSQHGQHRRGPPENRTPPSQRLLVDLSQTIVCWRRVAAGCIRRRPSRRSEFIMKLNGQSFNLCNSQPSCLRAMATQGRAVAQGSRADGKSGARLLRTASRPSRASAPRNPEHLDAERRVEDRTGHVHPVVQRFLVPRMAVWLPRASLAAMAMARSMSSSRATAKVKRRTKNGEPRLSALVVTVGRWIINT